MSGIFISYRRSDAQDVAGRIFERLEGRFSRDEVFRDVDRIPLGAFFKAYLQQKLADSDAALVLIGPTWLSCRGPAGERRLDDPNDCVRMEIETAIAAGVPTIPITVSHATLPLPTELPASLKSLAEREGQPVRPDPDFHRDMDRLLARLEPIVDARVVRQAAMITPALLRTLLDLTQGWYNQIIDTAARLSVGADDAEAKRLIAFYTRSRTYLPQTLSIRKLLDTLGTAALAARVDAFLDLLVVRSGRGSVACPSRPLGLWTKCRFDPISPQGLLNVKNPVPPPNDPADDSFDLSALADALQGISDEVTRLLADPAMQRHA